MVGPLCMESKQWGKCFPALLKLKAMAAAITVNLLIMSKSWSYHNVAFGFLRYCLHCLNFKVEQEISESMDTYRLRMNTKLD